jgi:hypothetical protein
MLVTWLAFAMCAASRRCHTCLFQFFHLLLMLRSAASFVAPVIRTVSSTRFGAAAEGNSPACMHADMRIMAASYCNIIDLLRMQL